MEINKKIFRNELNLVQQRHSLFFPEAQKRYVKLKMVDGGTQLIFTKNCNLDNEIRIEIMMAFKLSERTTNGQ